ncbi:MAG: oligoendopeptidase F [Rhodospirillaceae bacterium]|nr:oligoendopeptidase F [Rhodospirillaceae bacterium]|tara:strand:- start:725 stop:2506 length:1782 start_codon:yes stop_codon:yes gene_type:complete
MNEIKKIPSWDLSDLYDSIKSEKISIELEEIDNEIIFFNKKYKDKLLLLSLDKLYISILEYEKIKEKIEKIYSFVDLITSENLLDIEVSNKGHYLREKLDKYSANIMFFTLEINKLTSSTIIEISKIENISRYIEWINNIRSMKKFQLKEDLEKLLIEKKSTGKNSWIRLFDETIASIFVTVDSEKYSLDRALDLMSSSSKRELRKQFGLSLSNEFNKKEDLLAFILNTIVKDKEIEDRWRGFTNVDSSRHISNFIEPEIVDSLFTSVKEFYPRISHRYYNLKRELLGFEKLNFWDRNAPLNFAEDTKWKWKDAKEFVLSAFFDFSPKLGEIANLFFQNEWIDALPRKGKTSGAFSHQTIPKLHPYILMNFYGRNNDVMTLAHELGHGVHQVLASEQGLLLSDTPLILAETASVFGEQLVFQSLLKSCSSINEKKQILSNKIEEMINTVIRQISFYDFEKRIHNRRRESELNKSEINELWLKTQKESLGDAFELGPEYRNYWCYVSHFFHSPFYVYSYAFGDSLVNSLFKVYQNNFEDFESKYLDLLKAGGSKNYKDLIRVFNLDASNQDFWYKGLEVIENLIDELVNIDVEA